jgi:hypothetical protein
MRRKRPPIDSHVYFVTMSPDGRMYPGRPTITAYLVWLVLWCLRIVPRLWQATKQKAAGLLHLPYLRG